MNNLGGASPPINPKTMEEYHWHLVEHLLREKSHYQGEADRQRSSYYQGAADMCKNLRILVDSWVYPSGEALAKPPPSLTDE